MNAILWPVFDFVAKNRWLQIVLLIVTGLIIIRIWMWIHDDHVKKLERKRLEVESMKQELRVKETRLEIEERRTHDIEQARDAGRALPRFQSVDQLRNERPDLYAELFGSGEAGGGEAESR